MNVYFFVRNARSADEESNGVIYCQLDVKDVEKGVPFSTKQKVPVKFWMVDRETAKAKRIKPSTPDAPVSPSYYLADVINKQLQGLKLGLYNAKDGIEALGEIPSPKLIRETLENGGLRRKPRRLLDVWDEMVDSLEDSGRNESTMTTYRTRRNNLVKWLTDRQQLKLLVSEFRYRHWEDFGKWARKEKNEGGTRRLANNTINKHLTAISKALDYAVNKEYLPGNPIGSLNLEYDAAGAPNYLLPDARRRIAECRLTTLATERDVAVFLMHTGLSYTDYLSLGAEHVVQLPNGERFIKKARNKTNVYSVIPLLAEAEAVIERWGSIEALPRPDMSDLNKALKILGEHSKSPIKLSTSVFRDTFSSMMENEYMLELRVIMVMMGHTNPRQLRNYSSVQPGRILHELRKHQAANLPFRLENLQKLAAG